MKDQMKEQFKYRIEVTNFYKSRTAEYYLQPDDDPETGRKKAWLRTRLEVENPNIKEDVIVITIEDLDMIDYLDKDQNFGDITYTEPWILLNDSTKGIIHAIYDYFGKHIYPEFKGLHDSILSKYDKDQPVAVCYPLYPPVHPQVTEFDTFKTLRGIAPFILANMFDVPSEEMHVHEINKTFNPDNWYYKLLEIQYERDQIAILQKQEQEEKQRRAKQKEQERKETNIQVLTPEKKTWKQRRAEKKAEKKKRRQEKKTEKQKRKEEKRRAKEEKKKK